MNIQMISLPQERKLKYILNLNKKIKMKVMSKNSHQNFNIKTYLSIYLNNTNKMRKKHVLMKMIKKTKLIKISNNQFNNKTKFNYKNLIKLN